jgi:hypothetical protein
MLNRASIHVETPPQRLMASVAFSGGFGDPEFTNDPDNEIVLDVDRAAAELREAGYEVLRLPDKYRGHLTHPLDDLIEAITVGPDDPKAMVAIMHDVDSIVAQYGGCCHECGPIDPDHVPFADLVKFADHVASSGGAS